MAKFFNKLYVRIIISAAVGFFLASAFTDIQGPCTAVAPRENITQCVEFSKAVMHPGDLINNKQDTLTKFVETFAMGSLVSLALLSAYNQLQTKKKA